MEPLSLWGQPMKPVSSNRESKRRVPPTAHGKSGFGPRIRAGTQRLVRILRKQGDVFAAIGLAEGGDVEGAAALMIEISKARH